MAGRLDRGVRHHLSPVRPKGDNLGQCAQPRIASLSFSDASLPHEFCKGLLIEMFCKALQLCDGLRVAHETTTCYLAKNPEALFEDLGPSYFAACIASARQSFRIRRCINAADSAFSAFR